VGNPADWLPLLMLGIAAAVFGKLLPPLLYIVFAYLPIVYVWAAVKGGRL
jgi:hypothetical protein